MHARSCAAQDPQSLTAVCWCAAAVGSGGGSYPAGGGSYPAEESGLFSSLSVSLSALAAARRRGPAADVPASPSLDAPSVSYLDDEEEPLREGPGREGPGRDGPGRDGALGALPSSRPVHVVTAAAYPAFPAGPGRSGPFLVGGGVAAVEGSRCGRSPHISRAGRGDGASQAVSSVSSHLAL